MSRLVSLLVLSLLVGCASDERRDPDFHTSGSREADQRAEQRIAKDQQLRGASSEGEQGDIKRPLYTRLGGEAGINAIVDDFVTRVLADPRVNWERKGIKTAGVWRSRSVEWEPNAQNVATLKKHLAQFFALSTGGPSVYSGKDMKAVHENMKITNAEFDATVGDLKATLDKLRIPTSEQKELLAVVESTRPQVVEQR